MKVLGDQVAVVVRGAPKQAIKISALSQVFTQYYGYTLKPSHYGCKTLLELIKRLRNHVEVCLIFFCLIDYSNLSKIRWIIAV